MEYIIGAIIAFVFSCAKDRDIKDLYLNLWLILSLIGCGSLIFNINIWGLAVAIGGIFAFLEVIIGREKKRG